MSLSHDIISEFVKVTNNNKEKPKEGIVYATIVQGSDGKYVKIDGSDLLTPADTTTDIEDGERVTVMIKDHKATVTGNVTSPSASGNRVDKVVDTVTEQIGVFETVVADKVSTNELEAYKATIEYLVAGKATIEDLEATNAVIENLKVKDAEIENAVVENLEATKADIQILNADFAQIKTLVSGNLTSDNILSFNITADKVTMEDAFIKDAMIANVNAAKINAGRINTNSVVIGSEDGGMRISGATQQFTDKNGNVRIQIGRDASNDFTFALYGEDGQGQIINQNGITASAIADGLIVNDMVSDNAAISGGKLDISSVVTEINNDNTTTIKSNKIYLDEQNQSLEVAFKSLKTQVDTIKDIDSDLTTITDKIQSNTSKIEANKSSISTLIAEDAAIKKQVTDLEGNVVETTNTLTSKYTSLQQNLDGFKTTVNNTYATKTSVNDVKNNLSSNYSTTSAMNSAINQKVDEISASISSTYATKNEVKSIDDNIRTNYSTTNQMSSAISVAKDEINLGISQVYETKTEVTNKVTNAVSAIRVGGTNLITKKSGYTYGFLNGADGNPNNSSSLNDNQDFYINKYFPIKNGETVFFTAYPKEDITSTLQSGVYIHVYNTSKQWVKQVNNVTSAKAKSQVSYKATSDGFIRFSGRGFNDYNHMAEYTTIPTTWSPAPEDIDSAITNAGTSAVETSKSYTDSQIKLSKDSIELGISQTYETKTSVSSQVSTALTSAKSYADTKKSEAISTASSDATTKANNALTSAKSYTDTAKNTLNTEIGKKANSADVYTKTEVYTKTQTDSAIKTSKDAINLSVSQTYETKTEVTNKVTNAVNAIKIGSTNLITKKSGYTYGYLDGGTGNPNNTSSLNSNQDFYVNKYFPIKNGETVFFTAYPKEGITSTLQSGVYIHVYNTSKQWIKHVANTTSTKTKSQVSYKATADGFVRFTGRGFNDYNHMAEYSTIPSQWSPAPEDIDTTINTSLTTAKSYADSQIKVAKDAITSSVSSTYETKTNVQNKIDAIQVGGTNLIKKKSGFTYGYLSSSNGSTTNTGSLNGNQDFYTNDYIFVKAGTPIIFSSYPKQGVTSNIQGAVYIHLYNTNKVWQWCKYNITNTNQSARVTYTTEGDCYIRFSSRGFNDYNHKAEYGTKATDWSPAPEDIETTVSNLTQRVSTAESKITDTAITNVVKQNFYTKTETNDQITSKGYQTASQVQQTVDALQLKFTQSGGYNRVRNGIFKDGISQWSKWGSPTVSTKDDTGHSYGKSLVLVTTGTNQGVQQNITDLCSGKNYTLSAYVYTWAANDCGIQVACGGSYYSAKVPSSGSWQRISVTFKATATSATVQIGRGSWGANGQHLFTAIQFEEGDLATTYSPNPNEMYDGIIKMDRDGVTVKSSSGAYTNFNNLGMNSFNNSGQQTLGIKNGGITFHPYNTNQLGAYVTQSALWSGSVSANGLAISTANNGTYISLGTSSLSDANTSLSMDQALTISASDNFQPRGINFWKDVHAHGYGIRQLAHLQLAGSAPIQFDYLNTSPSTIYEATSSGHSLYVMGGYQMHLGCMDGAGTPKGVIWMQNSTNTHSYTHWNFHNYTMYNMKTATSYANTLTNRYIETYGINSNVDGIRYLYRNIELVDGVGIRNLPNGYKGCPYDIVSIVCKGRGHAWVECEDEYRFIINGDCKSVNVEIIIYPTDGVMTMPSLAPDESPTLEDLPKKNISEQPEIITNEDFISVESEQE